MSLIQELKSWWNAKPTRPPFQKGQHVEYLGVEWEVRDVWHVDSMNNGLIINRINKDGFLEVIRLDYFTKLIKPIQ